MQAENEKVNPQCLHWYPACHSPYTGKRGSSKSKGIQTLDSWIFWEKNSTQPLEYSRCNDPSNALRPMVLPMETGFSSQNWARSRINEERFTKFGIKYGTQFSGNMSCTSLLSATVTRYCTTAAWWDHLELNSSRSWILSKTRWVPPFILPFDSIRPISPVKGNTHGVCHNHSKNPSS